MLMFLGSLFREWSLVPAALRTVSRIANEDFECLGGVFLAARSSAGPRSSGMAGRTSGSGSELALLQ